MPLIKSKHSYLLLLQPECALAMAKNEFMEKHLILAGQL
jgi:hypothetical protein